MKPETNSNQEISQEDLDALEAIESVEYVDGYSSDDLQQYLF